MMDFRLLEQDVLAQVKTPEGTYPTTTYDSDGDCIEFIASNEPFYAEQSGFWTVHYGRESGKSSARSSRVQSSSATSCNGRPASASRFTTAGSNWNTSSRLAYGPRTSAPGDMPAIVYKKLRKVAEQTEAEADVGECVFA
jgi:hypothetical protein